MIKTKAIIYRSIPSPHNTSARILINEKNMQDWYWTLPKFNRMMKLNVKDGDISEEDIPPYGSSKDIVILLNSDGTLNYFDDEV